jgi:hypothetical protein
MTSTRSTDNHMRTAEQGRDFVRHGSFRGRCPQAKKPSDSSVAVRRSTETADPALVVVQRRLRVLVARARSGLTDLLSAG